jgi:adenine deaminase
LEENGHMDHLVRTAISFGLPPIRAIQMASINTARYFGLKNMGAIAPGFRADFILLDDLNLLGYQMFSSMEKELT